MTRSDRGGGGSVRGPQSGQRSGQLSGQWALITGATAGFGLATAELLGLELGMNLILTGRRQERLESLAKRLREEGKVQVRTLAFDIRDAKATAAALNSCAVEMTELAVLINNAGLALGTDPMPTADTDHWDTMIDTNIKGLLYVTRAVLPHLLAQNGGRGAGHIVNIGSVAGRWTYPGGSVYSATKFAVRALTESLRMDLFGKQIRVTNIEPGLAETEFSRVRFSVNPEGGDEKAKAVYEGITALSARDIAETIAWCIERPAHVNIQELVIYPTAQVGVGAPNTYREPAAKPEEKKT